MLTVENSTLDSFAIEAEESDGTLYLTLTGTAARALAPLKRLAPELVRVT